MFYCSALEFQGLIVGREPFGGQCSGDQEKEKKTSSIKQNIEKNSATEIVTISTGKQYGCHVTM